MSHSDPYPTEQALLGAILSGYAYADEIMDMVQPKDFMSVGHEAIFEAIEKIVARGEVADAITVKDQLGQYLERIQGGAVYLIELAQSAPNVNSAPTYARQVKAQSLKRGIGAAGQHLIQLSNADLGSDELIGRSEQIIKEATSDGGKSSETQMGDSLPDVLHVAENGRAMALATPWPRLDDMIRGMAPGRLIVIGARPGVGKSLAGTNLAVHMAHEHNHAVLLCSMEMGSQEVTQRMLSAHASVNLTTLETGKVTGDAWGRINKKNDDLKNMPIFINDNANQTLASIRLSLRNVKRRRPDTALVVVDYLQLMGATDKSVNRVEQIGHISRGLKIIAREFDVCVVAMAQVNRASMHRQDSKPTMGDLRESGSIEADADIVILLHRPIVDQEEIEVTVAKNRSGETGETTLKLQGYYARLVSPKYAAWTPTRIIEGVMENS